LIAASATFGCGPAQTPSPTPANTEPPANSARAHAAEARPQIRWTRFDEVKAWSPVSTRPFTSRGHGAGRYTVEVVVDAESRALYAALLPGTTLPDGSVLVALHHDPKLGRPGPIYVMEKIGGAWEFLVVTADGKLERRGELELCRRCHAEAVSDHVFGLPVIARPSPDAGTGS
jgi:hypothetical protein